MTNEPPNTDTGYVHLGKGIYEFTVKLFKRGNYRVQILLKDTEGVFRSISGSPYSLEV